MSKSDPNAPVTMKEVLVMARAAGLNLPPEHAAGVAQRLSWVKAEALQLRKGHIDYGPPFTGFTFLFPEKAVANDHLSESGEVTPTISANSQAAVPTDTESDETISTDLNALNLTTLAAAIRNQTVSPTELVKAYLSRIERLNPSLRAYITVTPERALADAARAEAEIRRGIYRGAMHGIPIAHKDLLPTQGIRTTYHTHYYKDHVPDTDAPIVRQLAEAGAVLLGKSNTFELGSGDGDVFGLAVNPWDSTRQTGGSSSGSAVAVAARLAAAATGTDAGGSIRVPSAFCGIFGLKPTAGVVETVTNKNAISVVGPMTRTARDAAIMFEAMVRHDAHEHLRGRYQNLAERINGNIVGVRIGVPVDWLDVPLEDEVAAAVQDAVRTLADNGAEIREVHLPHAAYSEVMGALITHVDCFSIYRHLLNQGALLGSFVRELLTASQLYSAADYVLAQRVRTQIISEVNATYEVADILIAPVVPYSAARLDQTGLQVGDTEVNPRTGMGRFTRLSNLTGHPSASVPTGINTYGMPLAVQLLGRPYDEHGLLQVAHLLERAHPLDNNRLP